MSKGSSKVRAAEWQGGYTYLYIPDSRKKIKIFSSFSFFLPGSLVGSVHAGPFVYCNNSVHCDFSWRTSYPAPEIQYSRSNSKRKIPTASLSHNATVAATGFRAYERYASRQKSTRERARERASERERHRERERAREHGGSARGRQACQEKTVHDKPENERGEHSELYTKSLLYVDEWTNFQLLLSFFHSFIHATFALLLLIGKTLFSFTLLRWSEW